MKIFKKSENNIALGLKNYILNIKELRLDEIITTVSSQRYHNIITQNIITKFKLTWNSITKLKSE